MNVIYHSVNVGRVVMISGGTVSQHAVIELILTFCTKRWWGPKLLVLTAIVLFAKG